MDLFSTRCKFLAISDYFLMKKPQIFLQVSTPSRALWAWASLSLPAQVLGSDIHAKTSLCCSACGAVRGAGGALATPSSVGSPHPSLRHSSSPCKKEGSDSAGRGTLCPHASPVPRNGVRQCSADLKVSRSISALLQDLTAPH